MSGVVLGWASALLSVVASFWLPISVALLAVILTKYIRSSFFDESFKIYGVPVSVPGPGLAYRNRRYLALLETPFEGGNTIPALFDVAANRHRGRRLLGTRPLLTKESEFNEKAGRAFEKVTLGPYEWESYERAHERAVAIGGGLMRVGHGKGEKVAIFAETRAEWFLSLQGAFQQGLVVVTVYASLGQEALVHSLNETEVTTVFCDAKQLAKLLAESEQLKTVKRVVVMPEQVVGGKTVSAVKDKEGLQVLSLAEVEEKGVNEPVEPSLPSPSDIAVIMYTSGSTGMPKGVMMSHGNLVATIAAVMAMVPNAGSSDVYFAYLPLAHVLELAAETGMVAIGASIGYGTPLTMIDSASKIKKGTKGDTTTLKPTLMAAVPAILDRIRDGVRKQISNKPPTIQKLFQFAYDRRLKAIEGSWLGAWGLEQRLWDSVVFKSIRGAVGGHIRYMLSGGAPLSPDTQRFMNICFNIPIGQGYGLTETCAGGTFLDWHDHSVGRVGPPIPCTYIKLINWEEGNYLTTDKPYPRGEICIGGPSVTMGYFNNPEKSAEVYFVDEAGMRWFHTGDIGLVEPDGVFRIIDRKKDIVKLQAGEYVSLGKVEAVLAASPYVDNCMVHAESSQSFAVALIVPKLPVLTAWAEGKGVFPADPAPTPAEVCANSDCIAEVLKSLQKVGKDGHLEKFEIPQKIKLLPEPWTPESGLVTAALKLKRESIRKAFADDLAALYK